MKYGEDESHGSLPKLVASHPIHLPTSAPSPCPTPPLHAVSIILFMIFSPVVTCGYLRLMQSTSLRYDFIGYSDPAVEGTSVYFTCPLGEILTGPNNISTCTGNGEWEPDPREKECSGKLAHAYIFVLPTTECHALANCEPPYNNHTNLTMTYNSTIEGSVLTFRCQPGLNPNDTYTAVCHRNASWIPDPALHRCITRDHDNETSGILLYHSLILYTSCTHYVIIKNIFVQPCAFSYICMCLIHWLLSSLLTARKLKLSLIGVTCRQSAFHFIKLDLLQEFPR